MISSVCAWRWKDRTPPERIAPSFSVNRVNYLYNEICKVVNFSSSFFLPLQLFSLPRTFPFSAHPEPPCQTSFISILPTLKITSLSCISISSFGSRLAFYSPHSPAPCSFPSTPLPPAPHLLCLLLFWLYLSLSQSLLIHPGPSPPTSQGSGHLIYRACLLHRGLHFPPLALTDRSLLPLPLSLRVHIDHGA